MHRCIALADSQQSEDKSIQLTTTEVEWNHLIPFVELSVKILHDIQTQQPKHLDRVTSCFPIDN